MIGGDSPGAGLAALAALHCRADAPRLPDADLQARLPSLPGWTQKALAIEKTFTFGNYYETIAFVNAVAYIAHREDHHPDLGVHYNRCVVTYSTHSAGGVTLNDLICAARVESVSK
jgi:4a-hydroxytetrahydrobiopterin dehydratase